MAHFAEGNHLAEAFNSIITITPEEMVAVHRMLNAGFPPTEIQKRLQSLRQSQKNQKSQKRQKRKKSDTDKAHKVEKKLPMAAPCA